MSISELIPSRPRGDATATTLWGTPPLQNEHRRSPWLLLFIFSTLAASAGAVLFLFDPARHGFYPACLFYRCTGLQCPGCGSLRALHHLLHGDVLQALRFNALLVLSLPFAAVVGWRGVARWFNPPVRREPLPTALFWGFLVLVTTFAVLRNLPRLASWFSP